MNALNLFTHLELRRIASEFMKKQMDWNTVERARKAISLAAARPDLVRRY